MRVRTLSTWPDDKLATSPGFNLALSRRQQGLAENWNEVHLLQARALSKVLACCNAALKQLLVLCKNLKGQRLVPFSLLKFDYLSKCECQFEDLC